MLSHSEINSIAVRLYSLKLSKEQFLSLQDRYLLQQEEASLLNELKFLISRRLFKYSKFDNASDLEQDAYVALLDALKTFKPERGNFVSWLDYYVKTKVSRQANKHSVLNIPMKKVKDGKPIKLDLTCLKKYEVGILNLEQNMLLKCDVDKAINKLSDLHIQMLNWVFQSSLNFKQMSQSLNIPIVELRQNWKEIKTILKTYA